jgi:hypothetical protein
MKKALVALATALCAAAVFTGGIAASGDGGTVVDSGFACAVFDGNGNLFITTDSTLTEFGSKAVLRCQGTGAPARPARVFDFANTGLECNMLQFGSTQNWSNKVGWNGLSQLVCIQALPLADGAATSAGAGIAG